MDDYYALLGVDADAQRDDIRTAYQEKRAALATAGDDSKSEAARLNKAWNVLSDPYQRGRYDEQRSQAEADGELDEVDELETASATPRARRQAAAQQARQQPTIELPPGKEWAPRRSRIIAMVIDLVPLALLLLLAIYVVGPAIAQSMQPETVDRIEKLSDQLDAAREEARDLDKKADNAEDNAEESGSEADKEAAQDARKAADAAEKREEDLTEQHSDQSRKLNGIMLASVGGAFLLSLLYLVVPSARTGQTLGKRLQGIKVLRLDGSPIAFSDALRRYGLVILATFALFMILGQFAPVIVLFGVTGWMRNANNQGLHDKFAKTIVVADDTDGA